MAHAKDVLFGIELNALRYELFEGSLEVGHQLVGMFGLDYDVVHICLNDVSDEFVEAFDHTALKRGAHVFNLNGMAV